MGSATETDRLYRNEIFSNKVKDDDFESLASLLNEINFGDSRSSSLKDANSLKVSVNGVSNGLCDAPNGITDFRNDLDYCELPSAQLSLSVIPDSSYTSKGSIDSEDHFSELLQSVAFEFGDDNILKDFNGSGNDFSLADLYFNDVKVNGSSLEEKCLSDDQSENCLEELLADLSKSNGECEPPQSVADDLVKLLSSCITQESDEPCLNLHLSSDSKEIENGVKPDSEVENCNFSLADLYYNRSNGSDTKPGDCSDVPSLSISEDSSDFDGLKVSELSDEEKASLSDDDVDEELIDEVDLSTAVKKLSHEGVLYGYPNIIKHSFTKSPLIKSKPSLFCKVLCAKPKKKNLSSLPKVPSNLREYLEEMDYCKYFAFDCPSPDDIIKQKQNGVLK